MTCRKADGEQIAETGLHVKYYINIRARWISQPTNGRRILWMNEIQVFRVFRYDLDKIQLSCVYTRGHYCILKSRNPVSSLLRLDDRDHKTLVLVYFTEGRKPHNSFKLSLGMTYTSMNQPIV